MDSEQIKELIELISRSNFQTFELQRDDFRLKLVKSEAPAAPVAQKLHAPAASRPAGATADPALPEVAAAPAEEGLYELSSPIVGTFYSAPRPDAPSFVDVGARVTKGQVVCIVEAMKVMNEIESEIDAEVVEILVTNGQPVEYGEVLFRLRPSS